MIAGTIYRKRYSNSRSAAAVEPLALKYREDTVCRDFDALQRKQEGFARKRLTRSPQGQPCASTCAPRFCRRITCVSRDADVKVR